MNDPKATPLDLAVAARRRPALGPTDAAGIARERFGLAPVAPPIELPSERDRNFRIGTEDGREYVLKISAAGEPRAVLEREHAAMAAARAVSPGGSIAAPVTASAGGELAVVELEGREHLARVMTWVAGTPLAQIRPRTPELHAEIGRFLGGLDRALAQMDLPGREGAFKWNLLNGAAVVERSLEAVRDPGQRALLERELERVAANAALFDSLRRSLVHHDANDHNVLVREDTRGQELAGLIDFGDMVHGFTLAEVAVASAYAMLAASDPIEVAAQVLAGYHAAYPVPEAELPALLGLVRLRLATSVAISAAQAAAEPENEYLAVSEAPAWALLAALEEVPPRLALARFRAAIGLDPAPHGAAVSAWLAAHRQELTPVIELERARIVDLSAASLEIAELPPEPDVAALSAHVAARLAATGGGEAVGRYAEPRLLYGGELFGGPGEERRTVHLGIDLFVDAGTPVVAPMDGVVHALRDNTGALDYGPTLVLRHEPQPGLVFFTLYGHLARATLEEHEIGDEVRRGERVARVGDATENGGWPPHLHLQLLADELGLGAGFPGVCAPSQRAAWLALCPDPAPLAGLAPGAATARPAEVANLRARRREHVSEVMSVSYRKPLAIVRGYRQHLYDALARRYLDAVNNVPHVGHCHPRVVRAAREQMALLETNTRYLNELLPRYAERLAATLPAPLEVVFLTNSGSEANELAIRLARAHTGSRDAVVLEAGYHGNTTTLIEHSDYKLSGRGGHAPPEHVHVVPMPDLYRGRYREDDPRAAQRYAEHVRAACEGRRVGYLMAEPLLGCGGQIVPPPGYLAAAFEHVRAAGGVCIADEVQVGFGRVGTHLWAFESHGVVPDVITLGKPIGNGHPLGAVVTTRAVAESFDTGMEYFNTFGGNPVSCAVGLAVLDVIEGEGLQENALRVGEVLLAGLRGLKERSSLVGDVRGVGLYAGVELVLDREERTPAPEQAAYVVERMREEGVLVSTDGPEHDVVKIKPPMCFSEADAERLVGTMGMVLGDSSLRV